MSLLIEKYIKYKMEKIEGEMQYAICDFKGNTLDDLEYVSTLISAMHGAGILDRVDRSDYRGWHNDDIAFDREGDQIGITSLLEIPEGDWQNEFHYVIDRASFEQVVRAFAESIDKKTPFIYLIKLSNGELLLQKNLTDNNLILPASFPKYIKLTLFDEETDYQASIITSQNLFLLYSFITYFNLEEYLDDQFVDGQFKNDADSLLEEGSNQIIRSGHKITFSHEHDSEKLSLDLENLDEALDSLEVLQDKSTPDIYIIQKDDGKIIIRESLED